MLITPAADLALVTESSVLEVPLAERAWQELRARAGDDLQLATTLADIGDLLLNGQAGAGAAVAELAAALGTADAFEVLVRRFQEIQGRRAAATPPEIAELMAALAGAGQHGFDVHRGSSCSRPGTTARPAGCSARTPPRIPPAWPGSASGWAATRRS